MLLFNLFKQECLEIGFATQRTLQHHRWQIRLRIDTTLLVHFAIQMDGQTGDSGDGTLEINQARTLAAHGILIRHASGQRQVTIKPGVKQCSAVNFDTELHITLAQQIWLRLDLQTRAVGMGAHHAQPLLKQGGGIKAKSNQGRLVAGKVITALWLQLPRGGFVKTGETRPFQLSSHRGHSMEGSG